MIATNARIVHTLAAVGVAVALATASAPLAAAEKPPRYQFDQKFDFARLHTFDLRLDQSRQREGALLAALLPKLAALVEEQLVAKGYRRSAEQPDFTVTYDSMVADDYSSTSWAGHGEVAKGLLVLRFTEPAQTEPFWMGADVADITGRITQDKAWKKVDRATRRILAGFPPPR
jgi:hypothetical protein